MSIKLEASVVEVLTAVIKGGSISVFIQNTFKVLEPTNLFGIVNRNYAKIFTIPTAFACQ